MSFWLLPLIRSIYRFSGFAGALFTVLVVVSVWCYSSSPLTMLDIVR